MSRNEEGVLASGMGAILQQGRERGYLQVALGPSCSRKGRGVANIDCIAMFCIGTH